MSFTVSLFLFNVFKMTYGFLFRDLFLVFGKADILNDHSS